MIPLTWRPQRRDGDGELIGYLVPHATDDGEETVVPVSVFGSPLGDPQAVDSAAEVLGTVGLSCLADLWSLRLEDGRRITVRLVEASPDCVVVANADFGYEGDLGERFSLDVPVDDGLVRQSGG